jgi:hypothetical protein
LLFHPKMSVPPPPKHGKVREPSLVDNVYEILGDYVQQQEFPERQKENALSLTKSWVHNEASFLRDRYSAMRQDPSCDALIRWNTANDWAYHVSRLRGLLDASTFDETASVLQWSPAEKQSVRRWHKDITVVKLWSTNCAERGSLPPRELVDGWLVSSLIRSRYYQYLADANHGEYVWHPYRNYVLRPVTQLSDFRPFDNHLVELYLAGMICRGAMEEESDPEIVISWAENIKKLKARALLIPEERNHDGARNLAVLIAKETNLRFRWVRMERILEGAADKFVLPLIGIATGMYVALETGFEGYSLLGHLGSETFARPYVESVESKLRKILEGSKVRLKRLAKGGARRIFAVMKSEIDEASKY